MKGILKIPLAPESEHRLSLRLAISGLAESGGDFGAAGSQRAHRSS